MGKNNGKNSAPPEPPKELFGKIMKRIDQEEKLLNAKRRFALIFAFFLSSAIGLALAVQAAQSALVQTGFAKFISLVFSDIELVAAFWQSFALALLESLPITSIAVLSAAMLAFLYAFKLLAKEIKIYLKSGYGY